MAILNGIVTVLLVVTALILIVTVLLQPGESNGLGAIAGGAETFFGKEKSQAVIGVQMASAYTGVCLLPPLFGIIANHISVSLLPLYVGLITALMILMCEKLNRLEKS